MDQKTTKTQLKLIYGYADVFRALEKVKNGGSKLLSITISDT